MHPTTNRAKFPLIIFGFLIGAFIMWHMTLPSSSILKEIQDERNFMEYRENSNYFTAKHHIVFLKTHKTGGSTIQNILMRHASENGLLLVIPLKGNYLGHPQPFSVDMAPTLKPGYTYSIYTHHSRFNYDEIRKVMRPQEDVVFLTLMREPVQLFDSAYAYYFLQAHFGLNLTAYADVLGSASDDELHNRRFVGRIGRNQMAFDLGVDVEQFDDDSAIRAAASALERQFHLVMINERMEESLILLKQLLRWNTDQVVAFRHNARSTKHKGTMAPETVAGLSKLNRADKLLYAHFLKVFERKVAAFGAGKMRKEVRELKARTKLWHSYCMQPEGNEAKQWSDIGEKFKVHHSLIEDFKPRNLQNKTCENLSKAEIAFTEEFQQRQMRFYESPYIV